MPCDFPTELLALVKKHDPRARVDDRWGVSVITSCLIAQRHSIIIQPRFSVLADE